MEGGIQEKGGRKDVTIVVIKKSTVSYSIDFKSVQLVYIIQVFLHY